MIPNGGISEHIKEHAILGVSADKNYDGTYLKLDQTTQQDVDNGAPKFNKGLIIKSGQKLIFDGI